MSREVVANALPWVALFMLIGVGAAACGRGSAGVNAYDGGPLATNDLANPSVQVPALMSAGFRDTFSGPDGQPLSGRLPETATTKSSAWISPTTTNWRTRGESLILDAIADRDFRAVIDVGRPRNWIRARIVREEGMAGLVTRYRDEDNWVMVWSDGSDVVAGQHVGGLFTELGRHPFEWPGSGNARYFDLIDTGSMILAFIDGQEVLRLPVDPGSVAQGTGFFTRNTNKNRFDDFTVWAAPSSLTGAEVPASADNEKPATDGSGATVAVGTTARGSELFGELGCGNCHAVSGRDDATGGIAPGLDGVGDRAYTRIPGTPGTSYLRESIIDPAAFVVAGYPAVMPSFEETIAPADLESLIAYLISLSTGGAKDAVGVADSLIGGLTIDAGRTPEYGPAGALWIAEAGSWSPGSSGMAESGGARADNRLVIATGIARASVSADVRWSGGLAGVVARYSDPRNWIMAWYDPAEVIVIAVHSDGGFKEIERVEFSWGERGTTHRIKIDDYDDVIDVWVDESLMYSFDPGPVPSSGSGGLFSRGHSGNEFSRFTIVELGNRPENLSTDPKVAVPDDAGPQIVLPPDPTLAPQFVEIWRERRAEPHLAGSLDDHGYLIEVVADDGIAHPISITFGGGAMYVASGELDDLEKGAVYALKQLPEGGFGPPVLVAVGFRRATGILYAFESLYVSSRGVITRLRDLDGDLVADEAEEIVTGLPFGVFGVKGHATEHQTQGMRLGPDGRIYVVQGAITDRGPLELPLEGTIFSMMPDGSGIRVYATGFRNPFDIDFNSRGDMFTADNSANVKGDEEPPDELHYVKPGGNHGFPEVLGDPPAGSDVEKPLKTWFPAIAPGGLEFYDGGTLTALSKDDMLIAKWNKLEIARLRIELIDGKYSLTEEEDVIVGFGTPVTDVTVAPNGDIYVADWGGGRIFRIGP